MMQLRWAPAARRDLRRIELRVDALDPLLAGRIFAEIERQIGRILDFPYSAPAIAGSALRKLSIPRFDYLVIYIVLAEDVVILRVRHAHEDWLRI
ncbi:MAG: hypothetical protein DCF31_00160 [Alphaproteobacteria bacterium]|nr:MAG: hypothetical protein DCF31_00160 [Alphaproteobacteria bacterium]